MNIDTMTDRQLAVHAARQQAYRDAEIIAAALRRLNPATLSTLLALPVEDRQTRLWNDVLAGPDADLIAEDGVVYVQVRPGTPEMRVAPVQVPVG